MIELRHVWKSFGEHAVLKDFSLDICDGETLTIIGGSGTGKSVTLKHIVGLMKPDRGNISVDGQEITPLPEEDLQEVQAKFGFVFQDAALFDSLTVEENVAFGLHYRTHCALEESRAIVREKLALVGLKNIERLRPSQLSGGMRKRVAIARAIAMNPKYLLYDEPTTGLDPIMSDVISALIKSLQSTFGVTSVVVTHDLESAYKISNRIAMLYKGEIVQLGAPEEIRNTTNPIVKQFITGSAVGPIETVAA